MLFQQVNESLYCPTEEAHRYANAHTISAGSKNKKDARMRIVKPYNSDSQVHALNVRCIGQCI